jgi:hypothetical protein
MNEKFERMWKEAVLGYFIVQSQNFLGGIEKNDKNLGQDSQCPSQYLNNLPPKYRHPSSYKHLIFEF